MDTDNPLVPPLTSASAYLPWPPRQLASADRLAPVSLWSWGQHQLPQGAVRARVCAAQGTCRAGASPQQHQHHDTCA